MSYVLTFEDFQPSLRVDGNPWTSARIEEAATQDGTFLPIETFQLSPVDTDPANPASRTFTTSHATLPSGWYRVVFVDDANGMSPSEPVYHAAGWSAYLPTVTDVAELIPSRAKGEFGRLATFTADTQPTADQVEKTIWRAAGKVASRLGHHVPAALLDSAREVVALRAAMFVELTYFGDQIRSDKGPYAELKELYTEALADYWQDKKNLGTDLEAGTVDDLSGAGLPSYVFPALGGTVHAPGSELANDCYGLDW